MPDLILGCDSECLAQIGQATEEKETIGGSKYKEMFKLKALHALAFFILVYVGVEVTIGGELTSYRPVFDLMTRHGLTIGWIVTYMIRVRHGGPSSGYITTGFFGGEHAAIGIDIIIFRPHSRLDCRPSCIAMG